MRFPHDILERFSAKPLPYPPNFWKALCPAHDDHTPSLRLWIGRGGRLMIGCWTGCDKLKILASKGLYMGDLFPPRTEDAYGKDRHALPPRKIVATFDYHDEEGKLLFQTVRYLPKDFRQRQPDGKSGWKWHLDGVRFVPYRLPELLVRPYCPVFVVEGEGKADALAALGLTATCNVGGCGMGWLPAYSAFLTGRRCVILPDCDAAGTRHAMHVAGSLLIHGAGSIRVVRLPGLAEREDVVNWLAAGGTKDELLAIAKSFPEWRAAT